MNHDLSNTQIIRPLQDSSLAVTEVLERVYEALNEKGYNPISQIVGCIMSGDPTYYKLQGCKKLDYEGGTG